jgi:hypothetical protein
MAALRRVQCKRPCPAHEKPGAEATGVLTPAWLVLWRTYHDQKVRSPYGCPYYYRRHRRGSPSGCAYHERQW